MTTTTTTKTSTTTTTTSKVTPITFMLPLSSVMSEAFVKSDRYTPNSHSHSSASNPGNKKSDKSKSNNRNSKVSSGNTRAPQERPSTAFSSGRSTPAHYFTFHTRNTARKTQARPPSPAPAFHVSNSASTTNKPTASSTPVNPTAFQGIHSSPSPAIKSNLQRFWEAEKTRSIRANAFSARSSKRNVGQFQMPSSPEEARLLWESTKEQLWKQWEMYQKKENDTMESETTNNKHTCGLGPKPNIIYSNSYPPVDAKHSPSKQSKSIDDISQPASTKPSTTPLNESEAKSTPFFKRTTSTPYSYTNVSKEDCRPPSAQPPSATSSTASSVSPVSKPNPVPEPAAYTCHSLASLNIPALRTILRHYGLSADDCIEKSDLIAKIEAAQAVQIAKRQIEKANREEVARVAEREAERERIVLEIEKWAGSKPIRILLNDLNQKYFTQSGNKNDNHQGEVFYLTPSCNAAAVHKMYKKVLLRIHPDKHMDDWKAHVRASEMVKIINNRMRVFKEKCEAAGFA